MTDESAMTDGELHASHGPATNGNARDHVVTPVPPAASLPTAPEGDSFPGYLTCVISREPPARGVYFNVPCTDGTPQRPQAFEFNEIFRHISTTGYYDLYRHCRHPIYNGKIGRLEASSVVIPVPDAIQARCARERQLLGLPSSVDPLTAEDQNQYARMVERMNDTSRHPDEMRHPDGNPGVEDRDGVEVMLVRRPGAGRSDAEFAARRNALLNVSYESSSSDEEVDVNIPSLSNVRHQIPVGGRGTFIRP